MISDAYPRDIPIPRARGGCYRASAMETRTRWSALSAGATYVGIGVLSWLRPDRVIDQAVSGQVVLLGLWAAAGILAIGVARPNLFELTTRDIGPWLTFALAAPLALLSLRADDALSAALPVLWPLAVLPLGISLGGSSSRLDATWVVVAALTSVAIVLGLLAYGGDSSIELVTLHTGAITSIALAPALIGARQNQGRSTTRVGRVLIGLAPLAGAIVLAVPSVGLVVLAVGLAAIVLVNTVELRPLERAAARATVQRDVTVAAVEAERRRLAADIHDGPLQSLLLLGQQLDAQGHPDAAASARTIAAELRDVAGELRLPLLDDLGVGPALDWLADRARRMTGVSVTVEYEGLRRPPREVELAAFRIAQEAVANAIRHGEPPIVVTYRTTGDRVSLAVEDAGRGIGKAAESASASHGLLNMTQRAEQIGARLDLLHRPDRGMRVRVEWPAPA
jgi:signal transduction histidine kinase